MASPPDPATNSEFQTNQNESGLFIFYWFLENETIVKTRVVRLIKV